MSQDFSRHRLALQALQREAKKAQTLSQRNIITVYDFDRDESLIFMTMELLVGRTLAELLEERKEGLPRKEANPMIKAMCAGLGYAHERHIVHSDFKPGNVFLTDTKRLKILDFGIARATPVAEDADSGKTLFDAGELGGLTPGYAAPESFVQAAPDAADDVFSLGLVVYELLSGRHPFDKVPASEAARSKMVPHHLRGLKHREWRAILRALSFKRRDRYANALEFWERYDGRKARLRRIAIAAVVLPAITGTLAYLLSEDDGFSKLSNEKQGQVIDLLEKADDSRTLWEAGEAPLSDYQQYLDDAYRIHAQNEDVIDGLKFIADYAIESPPGTRRRLSIKNLWSYQFLRTYPPLVRACRELDEQRGRPVCT